MSNKFTPRSQNALSEALNSACSLGHSYVGSEHLLLGLLIAAECAAAKMLGARGASADSVKNEIIELSGIGSAGTVSPSDMTPKTKKIIEASAYESVKSGQAYIGTEHILLAILSDCDCVAVRILEDLGIPLSELKNDVEEYVAASPAKHNGMSAARSDTKGRDGEKGTLLSYGRDLVDMARRGRIDPMIGRENETERVIQVLSRRTKNNPCLIGEPGVGKTAVVEGLAQKIADGDVPPELRDKLVISLDVASMIAGAKYRGEFEERMKRIISDAEKDPSIIIFIDEIHTIIGAGAAEGAVDAANILKPALARGELRVIGATTLNEYRRYIEKDAALERRFQAINVGEPTPDEAIRILNGLKAKYEEHHGVIISDEAVNAAVRLSTRYVTDRFLPDKAIDLIDEAAARLKLKGLTRPREQTELEREIKRLDIEKAKAITAQSFERAAKIRDKECELIARYDSAKAEWDSFRQSVCPTLNEGDIAEIVTQWTGIPVSRLLESDSQRLGALEQKLNERVIGQKSAVAAVSAAVRRGRAGLKDPNKPIGSFIFAGKSGVGKTELCRALASCLFGGDDKMIRLDMSEYMERHSISKLIGAPPGYVGYGESGILCEMIRRTPYAIVLFDEIEKAHADIFNILLQILDDGTLTDSQGRRVDFKNSIIIMTTNVGVDSGACGKLGFSSERDSEHKQTSERVRTELKHILRPELLNRIDEIIVFNPLTDKELERITDIMLSDIAAKIRENGISIELDGSLSADIVRQSNFREYGARDLRRTVIRLLETPFTDALIRGDISSGDSVHVHVENGTAVFTKVDTSESLKSRET